MKKALQTEHRAQFQSQPSQAEPQSPGSLPGHASKKRKASAGPSSVESLGAALLQKKGPVTYSKRSKSLVSSPLPGIPGHATRDVDLQSQDGICWDLKGSMREDYAHHDPVALFPEPSSTIANATQTQLRVLEAAGAPLPLESCVEVDAPRNLLPPEPSVPWSDIMKFTPGDPSESSESSNREGPDSQWTSAAPVSTMAEVEPVMSQHSRTSSTILLKGSPLRHEVAREEKRLLISPDKLTEDFSFTSPLKNLSTSLKTSHSGSAQSGRSTHSQSLRLDLDADEDDDLAVGLPREQYKPRPSRSRSLKTCTQNEIDYSVIPERARKLKRHKTADATSSVQILTTPQKIQQICDMGFTPTTTKKALKNNSGDVTSTIEWLVTNRINEDELAPDNTPKKVLSTPTPKDPIIGPEGLQVLMRNLKEYCKDGPLMPQNHVDAPATASSTQVKIIDRNSTDEQVQKPQIKSPKVQVVIQKNSPVKAHKSPAPSQKKLKRRKTTLDQPEPESSTEVLGLTEGVTETKRCRGRPKKAMEHGPSIEAVQDVPQQDMSQTPQLESLQVDEPDLVSGEDQETKALPIYVSSDCTDKVRGTFSEFNSSSNINKKSNVVQPAEQSSKTAALGPTGKVPYRVGLSKRARIAPLLRVLKK